MAIVNHINGGIQIFSQNLTWLPYLNLKDVQFQKAKGTLETSFQIAYILDDEEISLWVLSFVMPWVANTIGSAQEHPIISIQY